MFLGGFHVYFIAYILSGVSQDFRVCDARPWGALIITFRADIYHDPSFHCMKTGLIMNKNATSSRFFSKQMKKKGKFDS